MTGVDGLRELRQEIAQALGMVGEDCDPPLTWRDKDFIQAAVLPVVTAWVDRVARERAAEDVRDERGHYHGKVGSPGEHRTVGGHRAWCHDCVEWCYPEAPCGEPKCCAALANVAREHGAGHDGQQR